MNNYSFPLPKTLEEAIEIQERTRQKVILEDSFEPVKLIAGVDVGFADGYKYTNAAVVVLDFATLEVRESSLATIPTCFPYIPGFLSFREIPAILEALEKLTLEPDLFLCDGQGIAHPRRLGLASHLGVTIDRPTIGVAKSLLVGKHELLGLQKGDRRELIDRGEVVGAVLRSRTGIKPLYISTGHRIGLESSIDHVMKSLTKYRLPEPTRIADKLCSRL